MPPKRAKPKPSLVLMIDWGKRNQIDIDRLYIQDRRLIEGNFKINKTFKGNTLKKKKRSLPMLIINLLNLRRVDYIKLFM